MDAADQKDHYSTLGVDACANAADIHDAYRRLAKQYHPDYAGDAGTAKFRDLHAAYEVLSDPEKRTQYDRTMSPQHQSRAQGADSVDIMGNRPSPRWRSHRYSVTPEPLIPDEHVERLVQHMGPHGFDGIGLMVAETEEIRTVLWALLELDRLDRF